MGTLPTSSLTVESLSVRPERSAAESKDESPTRMALFDFAASTATLRANGKHIAQQVRHYTNAVCFDLECCALSKWVETKRTSLSVIPA
jgi:hypothetical protein